MASDQSLALQLGQRIAGFPLFAGIEPSALDALLDVAEWFSLPGGAELVREGDNDRALFLVMTGCLGVYVPGATGVDMLVAHVPAGETVGEMSVLSGEPHSATIVALRDSELLRVSQQAVDRLIAQHPSLARSFMRLLIDRLRRTTRKAMGALRPRTFAFVPLQEGLDLTSLCWDLRTALRDYGLKVEIINPTAQGQVSDWFSRLEGEHDVVLYEGDEPDTPWTQLCIRQADRIVLVAAPERAIPLHGTRGLAYGAAGGRSAHEVVFLHSKGTLSPLAQSQAPTVLHHHVRMGVARDVARLARLLSGRAMGLVLAGGGARGFAHIGVVRALREAGMPVDLVGGASMGAIIAAGIAMEWDDPELKARVHRAFVETDPLSDFTLPFVALVRGRKVARLLRENFGEIPIEEMPIRYFCITSDLTEGNARVHTSGRLWRALQASVAIPGLLPPVVFDGHLHVDGGIMNNLPIDIMAAMGRGPVVGVDVAGDADLSLTGGDYTDVSLWETMRRMRRGAPGIVHILMRTGTVGNEFHRRAARALADLLIELPLAGVGLRDWQSFDRAVQEGYETASRAIERHGLPTTSRTGAA